MSGSAADGSVIGAPATWRRASPSSRRTPGSATSSPPERGCSRSARWTRCSAPWTRSTRTTSGTVAPRARSPTRTSTPGRCSRRCWGMWALADGRGIFLVINADDFGYSDGINRGIVHTHRNGVVTSTSLIVTAPQAAEALAMSRDCPDLSVGLHFAITDDAGNRLMDLRDTALVRGE